MAVKQFNLPDPGEGLTEAEVVTWRVQVGDEVKVNDVVVEVETAKSLVELPIPFAGTVTELLAAEGDTVDVGSPIISVETGEGGSPDPSPEEADDSAGPNLVGYGAKDSASRRRRRRGAPAQPVAEAPVEPAPAVVEPPTATPATERPTRALAKPPVRKLAKDLGVDIQSVAASGPGGTVTRDDVTQAADGGAAPASSRSASHAGDRPGGETRIPVKGVRKATAQAMVSSAFTAPHVTEFLTVDVTATMELVDRLRRDRSFEGVKVTPLAVVAKALCLAVRRHPEINASWEEEAQEIVVHGDVNLGIAAATPRGLVVPNVKAADRMDLRTLAESIVALATTAREGRTQPADFAGGTVTITNVGVFGVDTGTPIINPGEAAILAFGQVRRMPWVVTAADGSESIEPRWVTQLALSFDHRMVDGELGSRVLADIGALLHDPGQALVWS